MNRELEFLKNNFEMLLKQLELIEKYFRIHAKEIDKLNERLNNLEAFIVPY